MCIYIYVQWIWQKLWKNDGSWRGSLEIRHKVILFQENYLIFQVITLPNNNYSRCLFFWSTTYHLHPNSIATGIMDNFGRWVCNVPGFICTDWSNILCVYIVCIVFGLAFPSFLKVLLYAHVYECVFIYIYMYILYMYMYPFIGLSSIHCAYARL